MPVSCDQRSGSNGRRLGAEEGEGQPYWEPPLIVGLGDGSRADASGEDRHLPETRDPLDTRETRGRFGSSFLPVARDQPGSRRVLPGGASHGRSRLSLAWLCPPWDPMATCEACVVVALSSKRCCHRRTSS